MNIVEAGVSNFRAHSTRANTFFDKAEERWTDDERRRKRNIAAVSVLAVIITPFLFAVASKTYSLIIEILQIEQEWRQAHPSEFKQQKSLFDPAAPVFAKQQMDAGSSIPIHY